MKINGHQLKALVELVDQSRIGYMRTMRVLERAGLIKHQAGNAPWAFNITNCGLSTIELHRPAIYGSGYRFKDRFVVVE